MIKLIERDITFGHLRSIKRSKLQLYADLSMNFRQTLTCQITDKHMFCTNIERITTVKLEPNLTSDDLRILPYVESSFEVWNEN